MTALALGAWALACFAAFLLALDAATDAAARAKARALGAAGARIEALWLREALTPDRLVRASLAAALVGGILAGLLVHPAAGVLAAGALAFLPGALLGVLERRRRTAFEAQLPDALDALSGGLRSGFSLEQSVRMLADRAAPPMGQELRLALRETEVGTPLEEALGHLHDRMPGEDLRLLTAAVSLSREVGGSLAEVLEDLARTVRARREVRSRLEALTAQGRLQGVVLSLVPVGLGFALWALEPERIRGFLSSPAGWAVFSAALVLEALGILWIRRVLDVRF